MSTCSPPLATADGFTYACSDTKYSIIYPSDTLDVAEWVAVRLVDMMPNLRKAEVPLTVVPSEHHSMCSILTISMRRHFLVVIQHCKTDVVADEEVVIPAYADLFLFKRSGIASHLGRLYGDCISKVYYNEDFAVVICEEHMGDAEAYIIRGGELEPLDIPKFLLQYGVLPVPYDKELGTALLPARSSGGCHAVALNVRTLKTKCIRVQYGHEAVLAFPCTNSRGIGIITEVSSPHALTNRGGRRAVVLKPDLTAYSIEVGERAVSACPLPGTGIAEVEKEQIVVRFGKQRTIIQKDEGHPDFNVSFKTLDAVETRSGELLLAVSTLRAVGFFRLPSGVAEKLTFPPSPSSSGRRG